MFCKYCGHGIPENADFCPKCGKKLKKEEIQENESRAVGAPFILMMLLLCWDTIYAWGRILLYGYGFGADMVVSTLALIAGIAVVGIGVSKGKIAPSVYHFSDILVAVSACIAVPLLMSTVDQRFLMYYMGQNGVIAAVYVNGAMGAIQLSSFWMAAGVALLGIQRTSQWQPKKKQKAMLFLAPLLCILIGIMFASPIVASMGAPAEVLAMTIGTVRIWSVLCWLWPLMILLTFWRLGSGKINAVGATVVFLGMLVGECLLLSVFLFVLSLGPVGYGIAKGISPLFCLLILSLVTRRHKEQTIEVN